MSALFPNETAGLPAESSAENRPDAPMKGSSADARGPSFLRGHQAPHPLPPVPRHPPVLIIEPSVERQWVMAAIPTEVAHGVEAAGGEDAGGVRGGEGRGVDVGGDDRVVDVLLAADLGGVG